MRWLPKTCRHRDTGFAWKVTLGSACTDARLGSMTLVSAFLPLGKQGGGSNSSISTCWLRERRWNRIDPPLTFMDFRYTQADRPAEHGVNALRF